ncbi:MAG TPA: FAD-dependent oxidoreductase, partial [Acetobacteraceae bacterium]|nr:FAD-dependent oxidoreductase [Acetobacteraceae bacterium]
RVIVREKLSSRAKTRTGSLPGAPERIVVIGGGAAGFAAAERLRREGYSGALTMVSDDADAPYDRPNLSKDYLAGEVQEDQLPLRPASFYAEAGVELRLGTPVTRLDPPAHRLALADGTELAFDRLLIATGAEPVRPPIPGADAAGVLLLRSFRDCQAIITRIGDARHVVIIGASFIGLEVAASLRQRGLEVRVVAPERQPLEAALGPKLGARVRSTHENKGVVFHLGTQVAAVSPEQVQLKDGTTLAADLVVLGTGVRPRVALAEAAGLPVDNGVLVDGCLETPVPGIFAAGDVARWPDPHSGERIRVEHWVVAERMGQTAALNMLGRRQPFDAVPFFWSQHYHDLIINYLGHAKGSDEAELDGDVAAGKALLRYRRNGRVLAVATVDRDLDNLRAEVAMEQAAAGQ